MDPTKRNGGCISCGAHCYEFGTMITDKTQEERPTSFIYLRALVIVNLVSVSSSFRLDIQKSSPLCLVIRSERSSSSLETKHLERVEEVDTKIANVSYKPCNVPIAYYLYWSSQRRSRSTTEDILYSRDYHFYSYFTRSDCPLSIMY